MFGDLDDQDLGDVSERLERLTTLKNFIDQKEKAEKEAKEKAEKETLASRTRKIKEQLSSCEQQLETFKKESSNIKINNVYDDKINDLEARLKLLDINQITSSVTKLVISKDIVRVTKEFESLNARIKKFDKNLDSNIIFHFNRLNRHKRTAELESEPWIENNEKALPNIIESLNAFIKNSKDDNEDIKKCFLTLENNLRQVEKQYLDATNALITQSDDSQQKRIEKLEKQALEMNNTIQMLVSQLNKLQKQLDEKSVEKTPQYKPGMYS